MSRWILLGLVAFSLNAGDPVVVVEGGGYFPVLVGLRDGTLLAVFRGGAPHIGRGGAAGSGVVNRPGQSLVGAMDRCRWAGRRFVLADDSPFTDCGYPSSWEIAPGKIVTVYYQVDDLKNAPASAKAKAILWTVPEVRSR